MNSTKSESSTNLQINSFTSYGFLKSVGTNPILKPYGAENMDDLSGISAGNATIKFFVYGSEFGKGTDGMAESIEPKFLSLSNQPLIIKDHFEINGSDAGQIGWIEVSGESGQGGFLWYLKSILPKKLGGI